MIAPPPGLEPALDFGPIALTPQKEVVRKFYKDMWDNANVDLIPEIFQPGFTFRGSLGPVLVGFDQFADYVRWVTDSLENYTSDILDLYEDGNVVTGKLRFHGIHRKPMFGHAPTGRHVWWYGAPIFKFQGDKVSDLWVLGDIHGLIGRLALDATSKPEFTTDK
jgi:predicted ester cyclase